MEKLGKKMIGNNAFCPKTGAPLSKTNYYDDQGNSQQAALPDEFTAKSYLAGELTNGAVRSSKSALFNRFRRCHQHHCKPNSALYRKAALALSRLKRSADGQQGRDVYIWYALQRRLSSKSLEADWMHVHVEPRCPHCHGRLTYEFCDNGDVRAECGTRCTGSDTDKLAEIREMIADLYSQAFGEAINPDNFLQFE